MLLAGASAKSIHEQPNISFSPTARPAADLVPLRRISSRCRRPVKAMVAAGADLVWEQTALPLEVTRRLKLDRLFNARVHHALLLPLPDPSRSFTICSTSGTPNISAGSSCPSGDMFLFRAAIRSSQLVAVSEGNGSGPDAPSTGCRPDEIRVAPHGVDLRILYIRIRRRPVRRPYLLCVSTLHPHKNLDRLIRVFAGVSKTTAGVSPGNRGHAWIPHRISGKDCRQACPLHRLDSARRSVRSVSSRVGIHLPVHVRRVRDQRAGGDRRRPAASVFISMNLCEVLWIHPPCSSNQPMMPGCWSRCWL